jgi:hypothetical protein
MGERKDMVKKATRPSRAQLALSLTALAVAVAAVALSGGRDASWNEWQARVRATDA